MSPLIKVTNLRIGQLNEQYKRSHRILPHCEFACEFLTNDNMTITTIVN